MPTKTEDQSMEQKPLFGEPPPIVQAREARDDGMRRAAEHANSVVTAWQTRRVERCSAT